jgi:hypothetical protein
MKVFDIVDAEAQKKKIARAMRPDANLNSLPPRRSEVKKFY